MFILLVIWSLRFVFLARFLTGKLDHKKEQKGTTGLPSRSTGPSAGPSVEAAGSCCRPCPGSWGESRRRAGPGAWVAVEEHNSNYHNRERERERDVYIYIYLFIY